MAAALSALRPASASAQETASQPREALRRERPGNAEKGDLQKPKRDPGYDADVAFATAAPIFIGGQGTVHMPFGLVLQGELGVLPSFYVDPIDDALVADKTYDASVSKLVRKGLENALELRLSGGLRPFAGYGFEILGGYTLMTKAAAIDPAAALAVVGAPADLPLPALPDARLVTILHSLQISLGWRFVVADHFVIRASVGYLRAIASSSRLEGVPRSPIVDAAATKLDAKLDDDYKRFVRLPLVSLGLGYTF